MSDKTPYLYVIRKKKDIDDLDKYLGCVRDEAWFNFFCHPVKRYRVQWPKFKYLKTDLVAAITVYGGFFKWSEEAGINHTPRIEQRAICESNRENWDIHNFLNEPWQDYAHRHIIRLPKLRH